MIICCCCGKSGEEPVSGGSQKTRIVEPARAPQHGGSRVRKEDLARQSRCVDVFADDAHGLCLAHGHDLKAGWFDRSGMCGCGALSNGNNLSVCDGVADECAHCVFDDQLCFGDWVARVERLQRFDKVGQDAADKLVHQLVTRADQVVNGGGRDAGKRSDFFGGDVTGVACAEQEDCSVQDGVTPLRLVEIPRSFHGKSMAGIRQFPFDSGVHCRGGPD